MNNEVFGLIYECRGGVIYRSMADLGRVKVQKRQFVFSVIFLGEGRKKGFKEGRKIDKVRDFLCPCVSIHIIRTGNPPAQHTEVLGQCGQCHFPVDHPADTEFNLHFKSHCLSFKSIIWLNWDF